MSVFYPILRSVLKRKEVKVFLALSLTPLLYFLSTFLKTKLFSFSGPTGSKIAFFDFFYGQFNLQFNSIISSLALAFLAISVFRTEISTHILFLYKDIDKRKIFLSKILSLMTVVLLYCGIYFLAALFTYYTRVAYLSYGSLQFWSDDFTYSIVSSLGVVLAYVLVVMLSSLASLYLSNGIVITLILLFNVFMSLSGIIGGINWLFPVGYADFAEANGLGIGFLVITGLTFLYSALIYFCSLHKFKNLEF